MGGTANFKNLFVYQCSFKNALEIYRFSQQLPQYLRYDIADDLRRAARSVPSNIAEGYGRNKSNADIVNFLRTSLGSNDEVVFNLEFLKGLSLINEEQYQHFTGQSKLIGSGLQKLIQSLS